MVSRVLVRAVDARHPRTHADSADHLLVFAFDEDALNAARESPAEQKLHPGAFRRVVHVRFDCQDDAARRQVQARLMRHHSRSRGPRPGRVVWEPRAVVHGGFDRM